MAGKPISTISPQDLGLPPKFDQWYNYQEAALTKGVEAHLSGKRFVAQCRPVGSGKTVTAVGHALWLKSLGMVERMLYLTPGKLLQDQINRDFGTSKVSENRIVDVRGRDNYHCKQGGHGKNQLTCGQARKQCAYTVSSQLAVSNKCPYNYAKFVALNEPLVCSNYAFQLAAGMSIEGKQPFDMVVCDEAHVIEDQLTAVMETEIGGTQYKKDWGFMRVREVKPGTLDATTMATLCAAGLRNINDDLESGDHSYDEDDMEYIIDLCERLGKGKIADNNWVTDVNDKTGAIKLQPIWVGKFKEKVFRHAKYVLLMSGTINKYTLNYLGVRYEECDYSEWDYVFPRERSPIYWVHTATMTEGECRKTPSNYNVWASKVNQIATPYMDNGYSGVVHTVSYDRALKLIELLPEKLRARIITNAPVNGKKMFTNKVMEEYTTRAANGEGVLFISPSLSTGHDLKDELCRFNIIGKIPFEPGKGNLMKARRELDRMYGNNRAAQSMMQMVGRGNRNVNDWCAHYILDDSIQWFMKLGLLQSWFKVQAVNRVPPMLEFRS